MDTYHSGFMDHRPRERYASNNHHMNSLQQDKDIEHLKEVEHQKQQLERKCDELRLKHSELEQREKDLRLKVALDAYEQLCLNIGNEGRSSIRNLLVNLCQAEFERNFELQWMLKKRSKKIAQADKEVRNELESLFEKECQFAQTRAQGNIWMIGELYNYGILSDSMIQYYISRLLDERSDASWLWLCELILTVHASLVKNQVAVDKYFMKIKEIFKSKTQLSHNSETLLQNIILDWEANTDPESIESLAEEQVPNSEPVTYKPIVYTVQNYQKSNPTVPEQKPYRDFNNKHQQQPLQLPRGAKSRGRYRGFGNGTHPSYNMHNRGALYSSIVPMNPVDSYDEWYDQNMCTAYGFPKYHPFNDPYAQHAMRQGRPEQDMREQKMKKKPRQQQNRNPESNSVVKKELLDGEMKIAFRKQGPKKSAEDESTPAVHQDKKKQHSANGKTKTVAAKTQQPKTSDKREPTASPQHKLWSALGAKVDDDLSQPSSTDKADKDNTSEKTQIPVETDPKVPESSDTSSTKSEQSDDTDVLIESVTEEEIKTAKNDPLPVEKVSLMQTPEDKKTDVLPSGIKDKSDDGKCESAIPCEYSSGTSEYSSPMESPVPCESKEKSSDIWTRLSLLPHPRPASPTSGDDEEKTED